MSLAAAPACGNNPCGFWDTWGYASDECVNYLKCADPTDPRVIGFLASAANELGTTVGQFAGSTVGNAIGAGADAAAPAGINSATLTIGAIAVSLVALLLLVR